MPSAIAGLGWWRVRGVTALPGYSLFRTPWSTSNYSTTGTWTPNQNSGFLGGGQYYNTPAQNDQFTNNEWLNNGTYKISVLYIQSTDKAIMTWKIAGSSVGTIDAYNASNLNNIYAEITGITVVAGLSTVQVIAATKNASSSNYYIQMHTYALIRTGA